MGILLLSGCASSPSGVKFYNPATWFSGSEGRTVEKVTEKRDDAQTAVLKGAQRSAHEAQEALKQAGDARPVEVARNANDRTVTQLDQALGPLTVEEAETVRSQNRLLLSENAELRGEGERLLEQQKTSERKNSARFAQWSAALEKANSNLAEGFARENALANQYRNLMFGVYALVATSLIFLGLYVYARVALGGIPKAMAGGLAALRADGVIPPADKPNVFDHLLNRIEQAQIKKHT